MLYLDPKSALLDPAGVRREANAGTLTPAADRVAARPAERVLSPAIITGLAQVVEALLLTVLGFAIYRAYLHTGGRDFYVVLILSIVLVTNIAMNAARTHRLPVYRGPARELVELAVWVSRRVPGVRDLSELLPPDPEPSVDAAFLALRDAVHDDIGVYRGVLVAREYFGAGRHPESGTRRVLDFSFAYRVD